MNAIWLNTNWLENTSKKTSLNNKYREIGETFLLEYYFIYDTNYHMLKNYYLDNSVLTINDEEYIGKLIQNKFESIDLLEPHHFINSADYQPLENNKILITVTGQITKTENFNKISYDYVETMVLQNTNDRWYILSQIFNSTI